MAPTAGPYLSVSKGHGPACQRLQQRGEGAQLLCFGSGLGKELGRAGGKEKWRGEKNRPQRHHYFTNVQ